MTWQTDLYDQMVADTITLTNRPELDAETELAVRAATTNAHLTDAYYRDVCTSHVQLPNQSYMVALDIPTLFPNARGFSQIRPTDFNGNLMSPYESKTIDIVELGEIYDPEYKNLRNNIAYASGDKLVVRNAINCSGYAVEWVKAPRTGRAQYDSWIAQMAPTIIQLWAAATVFNTNGNEEKARSYLTQIEKFYIPQLKQNFLLGVMR